MRAFETVRPKNELIKKYVSYYYLDLADEENYFNEYVCYPHYNNSISIYQSNRFKHNLNHVIWQYDSSQKPIQLYTPIREKPLKVTQIGKVCKICIVFNPFGINQFLKTPSFLASGFSVNFFDVNQITQLFNSLDLIVIRDLLDSFLTEKYVKAENKYLEEALKIFQQNIRDTSIDYIAENKLGISRKHLNRLFQQHLNISPKKYRSIVRFRELMAVKLNLQDDKNFSSLSHEANYTDQSHFIKACKQLTGLTPSQFFKDGKIIGSEDIFWSFTR